MDLQKQSPEREERAADFSSDTSPSRRAMREKNIRRFRVEKRLLPQVQVEKKSAVLLAVRGLKGVGKAFLLILLALLLAVLFLLGACYVVFRGPSPAARDLLLVSAMETSAAKFIPRLFFSQEEIDEIIQKNSVLPTYEVTETPSSSVSPEGEEEEMESTPVDLSAVALVEVSGTTYKGKMLIVQDPSRVYVATPEAFHLSTGGMRVEEMCRRDGALAGINGGGFMDENGVGDGGSPIGLVISGGVMMNGYPSLVSEVIGFDRDNRLVVGNMSAQEALDRGIRDAVNFGPILVVNGEPAQVSGSGGGLNPRTAIGQREDGAVLLLVIDGRQSHSLGASYKDLIEIMLEFGAVNAANLDGGSSSLMVYEDEIITTCASLYGSRKIPTAFLVRGAPENTEQAPQ